MKLLIHKTVSPIPICLTVVCAPKPPSDEGGGFAARRRRRERKLPLSHAVRMTAPLTRGALGAVSAS